MPQMMPIYWMIMMNSSVFMLMMLMDLFYNKSWSINIKEKNLEFYVFKLIKW